MSAEGTPAPPSLTPNVEAMTAQEPEAPKVFVSHAAADNDRFALGFASRLRANGIDAWFDQWELGPGDKLVDRIFEQGIGQAKAFIVILSKHSIDRPWVRAELDVAVVRQIESATKLIPIVLDGVQVPEALRSTVWRPIADPSSYDSEFDAIMHAIFGTSARPPLGPPPAYTSSPTLEGLTPASSALLIGLVRAAVDHDDYTLASSTWIRQAGDAAGLSEDALVLELHRLERAEYLDLPRTMGGPRISHLTIRPAGVLIALASQGFDIESEVKRIAACLVNDGLRSYPDLASASGLQYLQLDLVLKVLEGRRLVKADHYLGGFKNSAVHRVDPLLGEILQ